MRSIERTTQFRRDYRREAKGRHGRDLDRNFSDLIALLADDAPLPERCHDHPLGGVWTGFRDCHLKPDLVLIYAKPDPTTLQLVRLGSHSELGF